ncbi:MAG: glycosyltransferase family 39 protein [Candidatus Azobacteroides sp.]|nr:glycosyltransferase family 39 protein [Candidatus Azobacteroides sp.]
MGSLVLKIKSNQLLLFLFLLIGWMGVNFIQAVFTEIHSDEAYYFLYSENLAWGYFDHPPMVGLIIFLSNLFFNGNLSIRFMTVLLQGATLLLCWKLTEEKLLDSEKVLAFFFISGSLIMFQAYGFITTPDVPFLFFIALFLWSYKKFLEKESPVAVLLLAVSMAGLIYSKYHAFLVIGFILLSNLKLLTRYKFWIAGILALLLLVPHIWWQASRDFPSFKYHMSDRNNGFEWSCFWGYIPNQMLVFNPLTLGVAIYILFKEKANDVFEKGMYFLIIGFIGFFWILSTFRYVEPHWTIACSIPIIILLYRHSMQNDKLLRFIKSWIAPSILLILIARVVLASGLLPERLGLNGKAKKCKEIESVAGDLPVVFTGSFQRPSNYHFFTQKVSLLLSAVNTRYTQFDFLQKELEYQGKSVFICAPVAGKSQQYKAGNQIIEGYFAEHFQSVNRVKIEFELPKKEFCPGDTLSVDFEMINPSEYAIDFQHPEFPVTCRAGYGSASGKKRVEFFDCELNEPIHILPASETIKGTLKTVIPDLSPHHYQFLLTLTNPICSARNSSFIPIEIKAKK